MVDFDKFEQNVKNNYGNQEFPFDEANWEKAAKLIDASRKGKNRGGIILWSATALLVTSGLVYYFGFSDNGNALGGKDLAMHTIVADQKNDNSNNSTQTSNENNSSEINSDENSSVSTSGDVVSNSNERTTASNVSNDNSVSTNNTAKINSSVSTPNNTEKTEAVKSNTESKTSSNNNTKGEENSDSNPTTASSNSNSKVNPTPKSKNTNLPSKSSTTKNIPQALGSENNVAHNPKNVSEQPATSTTGNTERSGNSSGDEQNAVTKKNDTSKVTDSVPVVVTATAKPTKSGIDTLPKMSKGRADSLAAMMPTGDGVSYATNVKEKHNAKNILFAEVGTTYLMGWHGTGKNEAGGFNVLAGVNFQHYFTGNVSAQIGVLYNTIDNLSNTSHTISTVKYDLGMEADVTSIRYQKLHYVVAPIKLSYSVKDNMFTVGCNVAYLLNSDSKKEKYKTFSNDPNATKNNLTSTKETGYVQGFNPYDIQITAGYRRKIYKGLSGNAEFFYGLTDTKNNSFFKADNFDRNVGFKVSLCYDLFKK